MYRWLYGGYLKPGIHYLRVGRKPLIIRKQFGAFLEEERRNPVFSVVQASEVLGVDKETIYDWLSVRNPGNARIPEDGWFALPTNNHIRIKGWAIDGLRTGEFRNPDAEWLEVESKQNEEDNMGDAHPYSLSVEGASEYFGLAKQTLYKWISIGKLHRGYHYLKVGRKPVIIRDAFIELMRQEDGSLVNKPAAPRDVRVEAYKRRVGRRNFD